MNSVKKNTTSQRTLPKGSKLNERYEICSVLGIGGFGITYKAYDIYNQNICAVKELYVNRFVYRNADCKHVAVHKGKEKVFEHSIARFLDEAGTLKSLNGTPNIVRITDYFKENGTAYFAMEYIDGMTIKNAIKIAGGHFEFDEAVRIVLTTGKCLDKIHREHYIFHRDISPENIMLDANKEPMIIDFGNAKNYVRSSEESLSVILKPGFAPPEQYTGKGQGPWTDVYSLAGVFYYMASGKKVPPSTERLAGETYTKLYKQVPKCSRRISEAVDRALALNPVERTQYVSELLQSLEEYHSHIPDSAASPADDTANDVSDGKVKMPYIVISEYGYNYGKWRLPNDNQIIVGRDGRYSNIVVGEYDTTISKQHCIISFDCTSVKFCVIDISTNGTFIKGRRMEKHSKYQLTAGERITFGKDKYVIEMGVEK